MPDVLGYLRSKGLPLKPAGAKNVHTACVFCNEDPGSRGRLYINIEEGAEIPGLYFCHLCNERGSLATLKRFFGDEVSEAEGDSAVRAEIMAVAASYYVDMLQASPAVQRYLTGPARGLSEDTVANAKLGYAPMDFGGSFGAQSPTRPKLLFSTLMADFPVKDILATGLCQEYGGEILDSLYGMITIPYMVAGNVVSIRGRTWPLTEADWDGWTGMRYQPAKGKYKSLPGSATRLFNSDVAWDADEVILTEGEFDALALSQHGFPAVGVPGANAWQESWDGYLERPKRVWLLFDRDETGEKAGRKLADRIGPKARRIYISEEGTKVDPSDWFGTAGHTAEEFADLLDAARRGGLLVTVREAITEFNAVQGTPGLKFDWPELDAQIAPGLHRGQLFMLLAKSGCLTGDTEIAVNRCGKGFKIPVAKMYRNWKGGRYAWDRTKPTMAQRADGGVVRLGQVSEVWYSGVKPVHQVTTDTGRTIKATDEHPFLTIDGWKKLGELVVGDQVLVNAGRSTRGRRSKQRYNVRSGLAKHPHRQTRRRGTNYDTVALHRLVAEAGLNQLDFETFLEVCRKGPVDGLTFLDPDVYAVHHIDRDPKNNDPSNLKVLTHSEHHALHAAEGKGNHVLEQVGAETVVSIEYVGEEDTYDISMVDEPHNFMANGFVVHNTGKTLWLLNMAHRARMAPGQENIKILFLSLEQTRGEWWDRARRIHRFFNIDSSQEEAELFWRNNLLMVDRNRLSEADVRQVFDDFAYQMGAVPDLVLLDYVGYFARGFRGEAYERTSQAVMAVKGLAKEYRVPILAPHQVSRSGKDGEEFTADSARDSGVIEETADFLLTMWNPDNALGKAEGEKQGQVFFRIAKSRHGGRGAPLGMQLAPVSLAMVPLQVGGDLSMVRSLDPLGGRARQELIWRRQGVTSWPIVVRRHRLGIEGDDAEEDLEEW